jgi:hypothetical protein
MRLSGFLLLSIGIVAATPALAETANDAPAVAVLRGSSAPPPQVIVQTVVYPEIVYVPTYYPAYSLYPAYLVQFPQHRLRQQLPMTIQTSVPPGFPTFNRGRR